MAVDFYHGHGSPYSWRIDPIKRIAVRRPETKLADPPRWR